MFPREELFRVIIPLGFLSLYGYTCDAKVLQEPINRKQSFEPQLSESL